MKKISLIELLIAITFAVAGYFIWQGKAEQVVATSPTETGTVPSQNQATVTTADSFITSQPVQQKNNISSGWKTFDRLGFTFQYPAEWLSMGNDAQVVNISGTITSIEISFADTISHSTFLLAYHLPSAGPELYRYALSQYKSKQGRYATGGRQIDVAGTKAIEANTKIDKDGRGKMLKQPLRLIIVDFLDRKGTGEIQIQFNTPLPGDKEVAKFRQVLSTFRFTK